MRVNRKSRPIFMYADMGHNQRKCVREFMGVREASQEMGISMKAIYQCLEGRTFRCKRKFDFTYERINDGIDSF